MKSAIFSAAALALLSSIGCAAPFKTQAEAEVAAKNANVMSGATNGATAKPTGVNISPITRNDTPSKTPLQLARDGEALVPIVLSDKAGAQTKLAAADLKKYLDQISGADFQIKTGDGTSGIVLGTVGDFPNAALGKALEIRNGFEGKESYAIRTRANKVLILGATEQGTSHGAYRFLETLGCRWFFPNPTGNWEVIPKDPNVKFTRDITDRPAFLARDIWYAFGWYGNDSTGHPAGRSDGADQADWRRRNHMGGSFGVNAGHSYDNIIRANAAEFEKHPEYYALVGGKRQGNQLEYGNPALRKLVVDWAIKQFKDNPDLDMVSVDPADGGGVTESPEAKEYGEGYAGNGAFKLANEVAVALQKAYPGQNKMVGLYAYNWHSDPPPFKLEPNVYIQLTMGFNGGKMTLDELFEEWPKKAKNLGFYDYYSTWRWDFDMWPGGRIAGKYYAPAMIGRFQKANAASGAYATSVSAESSNNWGVNGRGYYLASQLLWNPDLDTDAILEDFYTKAFGPAATAMKKYYSYQDSSPPMSPGVVGALFKALGEARDAAKDDVAVMRRLDDIANYLHYFDLNYRNGHEGADGKNDARTLEIQTLMYRNRYSNMNHWEAFRQDSIHEDANSTAPKPWKVDKPISHEETEAWFQDGLKHYPELKIPDEVKFSEDLVPVSFGGKAVATSQLYQEGSLYAIYSDGKPIHVNIEPGGAHGFDRSTYQLTDTKGKVIKEGKGKMGVKIDMDIPVPAPGVYYWEFHDHGAYGSDTWRADQIISLPLTKHEFRAMGHVDDMYFYVPKGTKAIEYYYSPAAWQFGGPHQISDSTGKVIKEVAVAGDYVSVPVPAGQDGKLWKVGGPTFGIGQFRFFNVPNYFTPSPNALLLPKELVARDGLKKLP